MCTAQVKAAIAASEAGGGSAAAAAAAGGGGSGETGGGGADAVAGLQQAQADAEMAALREQLEQAQGQVRQLQVENVAVKEKIDEQAVVRRALRPLWRPFRLRFTYVKCLFLSRNTETQRPRPDHRAKTGGAQDRAQGEASHRHTYHVSPQCIPHTLCGRES
eukprot:COSAG01_NODE_2531_length_7495_cov_6.504191_9_plen_162_part_00